MGSHKIKFAILLLMTSSIIKCVNYNQYSGEYNKQYYNDQENLICRYGPDKDYQILTKKQYAICNIFNEKTALSELKINEIIEASVSDQNIIDLKFTTYKNFIRKAYSMKQEVRIKKIKEVYNETNVFINDHLKLLCQKTNIQYLVIPIINNLDISTEREWVDIGNSYGDLQSWEMMTSGNCEVRIYFFEVEKGDFIAENDGRNTITDSYDTNESYYTKKRLIKEENRSRQREYDQRVRERERERREYERSRKGKKADGFDVFFAAIDVVATIADDANLISENIEFKQQTYTNMNSLYSELCRKAFDDAFTCYFKQFDGNTLSGNTVNGKGKFKFINGNIYDGEWSACQAHGYGIYTYSDGSIYKGQFSEGLAHGPGIYTDKIGNVFEGEWERGNKHGKGIYTKYDGGVYECICSYGDYIELKYIRNLNDKTAEEGKDSVGEKKIN